MANDLPESQNGAASSSFDPDLLRVGQRLAGVYTLKKVIPMAMGESPIWIADDAISEREVSLHFIPQEVGTDPDVCEALRSEVRRCRQFIHPHILRVHDLADEPEFSAVVMDSFEGQTLARMLQENVKGFWEAEEIVPWLDSILHTLSDAHGIGLLHRDLSLHDIIVTQDDRVLISGFGITRVVTDALRRRGHVEDLALSYTSPQLLGNGFASVADDVYAVGACLFEMLTGQPLFEGRGVLDRIRGERPPAVMEARQRMGRTGELLYPNWEKVIAQCLAKEAGERPPSIAKLQERLGVRAETPEVSLAPSGSGAGAAVGGGGGASAKEGSIRERLLERAREHSQAPQHMGVAGEEEGPSEDGEARETVSFGQRRPLLTSPTTPMEREMRSRNGALLWFLLIAGGGAALWFGANAVVQRLKPKPQPVVPAPEPVRPEDPDKTLEGRFVPPAAPGTPPELTALRPGLPMRPRSGAAEDSGGVGGGVPLVSSEPAAPRLNPPARPASPSPAPMPSAPSPASGGTVQSAQVPNAPSLPAKDAQAPAPDGAAPKADGQMENAQRLLD
ncbi:MAG: hypothetical protein RLZZ244_1996, partial [Verrucomicrobiota bacterium]